MEPLKRLHPWIQTQYRTLIRFRSGDEPTENQHPNTAADATGSCLRVGSLPVRCAVPSPEQAPTLPQAGEYFQTVALAAEFFDWKSVGVVAQSLPDKQIDTLTNLLD